MSNLESIVMQNPVVLLIGSILFIFTFLDKQNACQPTIINAFTRQLYHGDINHLAFNFIAFANLTHQITQITGLFTYMIIFALIFVLMVILDYIFYGLGLIECSIGFSGVVFGLLGWVFLHQRGFNLQLLVDLALLLAPSLTTPGISFTGHLLGLVAGMLVYPVTRM